MLWVLIEVPLSGASNEYHNISFCGEIRKISVFSLFEKKKSTLSGVVFYVAQQMLVSSESVWWLY